MGDIVLVFVEPRDAVLLADVQERARAYGCDFLVWRDELRPTRELRPTTEPYPRLEARWLLRRGRPEGSEDL